jgi:hypothetical protein
VGASDSEPSEGQRLRSRREHSEGLLARVAEGSQACPLGLGLDLTQIVQSTLFACMNEMSRVESRFCLRSFWESG